MLFRMIGPQHWRDHYSDCGAARCCLGCSGLKQVPLWKVNGCRYPGRFDVLQLAAIVGAQRPDQRGGRHATAQRAAAAAARGDVLGGLRPGDIPVGWVVKSPRPVLVDWSIHLVHSSVQSLVHSLVHSPQHS